MTQSTRLAPARLAPAGRVTGLLLPLLLAACSAKGAKDAAMDTGFDSELDRPEEAPFNLRIDVHPSTSSDDLKAQSLVITTDEDWSDVEVELAETITYSGTVTGFSVTPYDGITVPGEDEVDVEAFIRVTRPDTIINAVATSDEDGIFAVQLPAGQDYEVAIVPIDPSALPLVVSTDVSLTRNTAEDLYIDYGAPIFGQALDADGAEVDAELIAYIVDDETRTTGPSTTIGDNGHFMLRALPGSYTLVVEGDPSAGEAVPRVETALVVGDETAIQADVDLGQLWPVTVSGRVQDPDGRNLKDTRVRFTSVSLTDANGTLTLQTETDQNGQFSQTLLPGSWTVEYMPEYDPDGRIGPLEDSLTVTDGGSASVGNIALPELVRLRATVYSPGGGPMAGVSATAREDGFDGFTYSTTTDDSGGLDLMVPDVPLTLTLKPSGSGAAITRFELGQPSAGPASYELASGRLLSGRVTPNGDGASHAFVEVRDEAGNLYGTALTDGEGRFKLRVDVD